MRSTDMKTTPRLRVFTLRLFALPLTAMILTVGSDLRTVSARDRHNIVLIVAANFVNGRDR
jgi:hypothetical protein